MKTNSLEHHLHLMARWPDSWMGDADDLPAGSWLVAAFTPFLRDLHAQGLSKTTIRTHLDFLWVLGGEIIRSLAMELEDDVHAALVGAISYDEGPLLRDATETEQRRFDATCRRLWRFLERHPLPSGGSVPRRPSRRRSPARRTGTADPHG